MRRGRSGAPAAALELRNRATLLADIGGTKTFVAMAVRSGEARSITGVVRYRTADWVDAVALLRDYLARQPLTVTDAVLAVAGPVIGGTAHLTNVPWAVSREAVARDLNLHNVILMNDVEAAARAIPELRGGDTVIVQRGHADPCGTIGMIAPGTGLGEAYLVRCAEGWIARPSEGGHRDFAPATAQQRELHEYLAREFQHVSFERVCSGLGIRNIYAFLRDAGLEREPAWLADKLSERDADPTAIIMAEARSVNAPSICTRTLDLFTEILGAEVGNLALTLFATGGIYLSGGIPPRIISRLRAPAFMVAVHRKGRLAESALLRDLSIEVVRRADLALVGAAARAAGM